MSSFRPALTRILLLVYSNRQTRVRGLFPPHQTALKERPKRHCQTN